MHTVASWDIHPSKTSQELVDSYGVNHQKNRKISHIQRHLRFLLKVPVTASSSESPSKSNLLWLTMPSTLSKNFIKISPIFADNFYSHPADRQTHKVKNTVSLAQAVTFLTQYLITNISSLRTWRNPATLSSHWLNLSVHQQCPMSSSLAHSGISSSSSSQNAGITDHGMSACVRRCAPLGQVEEKSILTTSARPLPRKLLSNTGSRCDHVKVCLRC